jgi:hypothetical protein
MTHNPRRACSSAVTLLALVLALAGCHRQAQAPPGPEQWFRNPYPEPRNLAVTVFLNQSGSENLDMVAVTDEFYTELQQIDGLQVTPVNRVLAALTDMGLNNVRNPTEAVQLAEILGGDGLLVGSITRYEPYWPPLVGMAVQLYARPDKLASTPEPGLPPWEMSRAGKPFALAMAQPLRPKAMVIRIVDASQPDVQERLKKYAKAHGAEQTPFGWKKFATQINYLGFVSHEIIGELLAQEKARLAAEGKGK